MLCDRSDLPRPSIAWGWSEDLHDVITGYTTSQENHGRRVALTKINPWEHYFNIWKPHGSHAVHPTLACLSLPISYAGATPTLTECSPQLLVLQWENGSLRSSLALGHDYIFTTSSILLPLRSNRWQGSSLLKLWPDISDGLPGSFELRLGFDTHRACNLMGTNPTCIHVWFWCSHRLLLAGWISSSDLAPLLLCLFLSFY